MLADETFVAAVGRSFGATRAALLSALTWSLAMGVLLITVIVLGYDD
jgi:hypothetical protein